MRQHKLVLLGNRRQCLCCNSNIGTLNCFGHRFASLDQGVTA
jgi:hypothetical protein